MAPKFRSDLTCSREEQQGVVFYRIDDPASQASFRLYEIEYLIAQKLDGERELAAVVEAVKSEFTFDISLPDLERFVGQLESMSFLDTGAAPAGGVTSVAPKVASTPALSDFVEESTLTATETPGEVERLMKQAVDLLAKGGIAQARDYVLAARDQRPLDGRFVELADWLRLTEQSGKQDPADALARTRQLFADLDLGSPSTDAAPPAPQGQPEDILPSIGGEPTTPVPVVVDEHAPSRLRLFFGWSVVAAVCAGAYFLWPASGAEVSVLRVEKEKAALAFKAEASKVRLLKERWLSFDVAGPVARSEVKVGDEVPPGALLMALELPAALGKRWTKSVAELSRAQSTVARQEETLRKVLGEREAMVAKRGEIEKALRALQPRRARVDPKKRGALKKAREEKAVLNRRMVKKRWSRKGVRNLFSFSRPRSCVEHNIWLVAINLQQIVLT